MACTINWIRRRKTMGTIESFVDKKGLEIIGGRHLFLFCRFTGNQFCPKSQKTHGALWSYLIKIDLGKLNVPHSYRVGTYN